MPPRFPKVADQTPIELGGVGPIRGGSPSKISEPTELKELLAIPSISTLSAHKPDIQRAAEWLAANMRGMGLEHVDILPTAGHPVVVGDWLHGTR